MKKKISLLGNSISQDAFLKDNDSEYYIDLNEQLLLVKDIIKKEFPVSESHKWKEFTENGYVNILDTARKKFKFISFKEAGNYKNEALWRHDIDFSVHRAFALSEIEKEMGVKSTYFFMLESDYYNLNNVDVIDKAKEIVNNGHHIGLHFVLPDFGIKLTQEEIFSKIEQDKLKLENILNCTVEAVSFHNPDTNGLMDIKTELIAGMVNSYSDKIFTKYDYVSDSNGYWRFEPLLNVLRKPDVNHVHVLTHPGWWTPEALSPRERVERCLLGRANALMKEYDDFLAYHNRENIND